MLARSALTKGCSHNAPEDRLESSVRSGNRAPWFTTVQALLVCAGHAGEHFAGAIEVAHDWACKKWPLLADRAQVRSGSEMRFGSDEVQVSSGWQSDGAWRFKALHEDAQESRSWQTELALVPTRTALQVALRNSWRADCETAAPPQPSAPRMLAGLVNTLTLSDTGGWPVKASPVAVEGMDALDALVTHALAADRRLPMLIAGQTREGAPGEGYAVDLETIALKLAGLAHVVTVSAHLVNPLARELGQELAVAPGCLRIFYPGMTLSDQWRDHPVMVSASRIDQPAIATARVRRRATECVLGRCVTDKTLTETVDRLLAACRETAG